MSDDAQAWVFADAVRFVRVGSARIVQADAVKIVPNTAEDALYVHADHLGTPRKMTDDSRAVVWDAEYRPFGEADSITGTAANDNRFPGQMFDAETDLHYNYRRDYDPTLGRYIQSDPIGLRGGLNTYAYVNGNPVNAVDPDGLDVTVTLYPGAGPFGHIGGGVNKPNTTGFYPAPGTPNFSVIQLEPVPGAMLPDTQPPISTITIPTTPQQDRAIQDIFDQLTQNPGKFDLNDRNCATTLRDALAAGGINTPETIFPRRLFENLNRQFTPRPQ